MAELNININVENRLPMFNRLLENGDYNTLVREAGSLLEEILKKTYKIVQADLSFSTRSKLFKAETDIGKGKKGIDRFGLGELVGLYRESKFINVLEEALAIDLSLLKAYDMGHIVSLRNHMVHNSSDRITISYHEAKLIYDYVINWLAYLGYANIEKELDNNFLNSKYKDNSEKNLKEKSFMKDKKAKRKASAYSSSYGNEDERLNIQANNTYKIDMKAFKKAGEYLKDKDALFGLDVGCADGRITVSRFDKSNFEKVIGIDFNEEKIKDASVRNNDIFHFEKVNVEDESFEKALKEIMLKNEIKKFDIIFSALVLHHLRAPKKLLRKLRKFLNSDGIIILRGSDDGSKIAYPDDGIVKRLTEMTLTVEGVSDRLNGRKLYTYLIDSGFEICDMIYQIKDTTNMTYDERYNLFLESFMYRKDYFKKRRDNNPENKIYSDEYDEVCSLLENLEDIFTKNEFYYSETDFIVVGKKKK